MFCFFICRSVGVPQAVLKMTDSLDFWATCSVQCLVNDQEDPWKSEHWMPPSFHSLFINNPGVWITHDSSLKVCLCNPVICTSTKAIALVSVKCRRTRYLRLVSVLPAIDGSQHPSLVKQREEKHTSARLQEKADIPVLVLDSQREIVPTSFLDQSRWFICPTYLKVGRGNRVTCIPPTTNVCLFILSSHSQKNKKVIIIKILLFIYLTCSNCGTDMIPMFWF